MFTLLFSTSWRPLHENAIHATDELRRASLPASLTAVAEADASGLYSPTLGRYVELVHIPKTAGTALEAWGTEHGAAWGMRRSWQLLLPNRSEGSFGSGDYFSYHASESWVPVDCPPWHIPRREYVAHGGFDPYAGSYTFCPVRHPFARAVSNFKYQIEQLVNATQGIASNISFSCRPDILNSNLQKKMRAMLPAVRAQSAAWPNLRNTPTNSDDSLFSCSCHDVPQWMYFRPLRDAAGLQTSDCDAIVKQESLSADFASLLTRTGLAGLAGDPIPQVNEAYQCGQLTVADLDNTTVGLLAEVYALDFSLLNYTPTVQAALSGGG